MEARIINRKMVAMVRGVCGDGDSVEMCNKRVVATGATSMMVIMEG